MSSETNEHNTDRTIADTGVATDSPVLTILSELYLKTALTRATEWTYLNVRQLPGLKHIPILTDLNVDVDMKTLRSLKSDMYYDDAIGTIVITGNNILNLTNREASIDSRVRTVLSAKDNKISNAVGLQTYMTSITGPSPVDIESLIVKELFEHVLSTSGYFHEDQYDDRYEPAKIPQIAYLIHNINRIERGLVSWPASK